MSELHRPQENHLRNAASTAVQDRVFPRLEPVEMELGKVLYESGDELRHVYFPVNCIVSLLYVMENGSSAEISVVGNEGVVGVAIFMGGNTTTSRAIVQSAGYAQALITQMAQTAVCNRHHSIDQQLARWILLSLDRLQSSTLTMTHELIASMLGVRREGVTDAAGKLQRAGTIEYHRGRITVLDRPKLERTSCECYAVVKRETDRIADLTI